MLLCLLNVLPYSPHIISYREIYMRSILHSRSIKCIIIFTPYFIKGGLYYQVYQMYYRIYTVLHLIKKSILGLYQYVYKMYYHIYPELYLIKKSILGLYQYVQYHKRSILVDLLNVLPYLPRIISKEVYTTRSIKGITIFTPYFIF